MQNPLLSRLSRRGLLGSIVTATLGMASFMASFAYPGLARVITPSAPKEPMAAPSTRSGIDPAFWSGSVIAKTLDGLVLSSAEGTRLVRIPAGNNVWKEFWVSIDAVQPGEWVCARGEPHADGSLLAAPRKVWSNIGKWTGVIIELQPDALVVKRHDGITRRLTLSSQFDVIFASNLQPVPGGFAALQQGMQVGAVGLGLPDRTIRATRIWIDNV